MESLCNTIETLIGTYPYDTIWIAGNLNLPNVNWSDYSVHGNNYPLSLCSCFVDLINFNGFTQLVNSPTRGNNILDIFATNKPSLILKCNVVPESVIMMQYM